MPALTRARVCAVGSEADMKVLCTALLNNCKWLDEPVEDQPAQTLDQLVGQIKHHANLEGGEDCGFYYSMVNEHVYGDALAHTCRMTVRKHPAGLWIAGFSYDSETPFQPEDWLRLHQQCCGIPMLALYADWDFGLEKGLKLFIGGKVGDDWTYMGETWLWLMERYEDGYPPEEAVDRLRKLRKTLEREEFDLSIGELLQSCIDNLTDMAEASNPAELQETIRQCREERDFNGLFDAYCRVADSYLWELEHVKRHLACLEATKQAWCDAEGEDA